MRLRSLTGLALQNVAGSAFRSWLIALCALLIAAFVLATVLVVRGAQDSLSLANARLGADIVVVPKGAETSVNGALLMGTPTKYWMPDVDVDRIAALPGVAAASPQLYLESLSDAACCSVPNMLMVAFDPATDFTLEPWLKQKLGRDLAKGEAVGGSYVYLPPGMDYLELYAYALDLRGHLEPTGTNLDRTVFMTFDTAREMAAGSRTAAVRPLEIPEDSVSSVMVKLAPGADAAKVAAGIEDALPEVAAVLSPNMFSSYRAQITGLLRGLLIILALTIVLSGALLAMVFSMAAHERSRQIGVLRALGATRGAVLWSFLTEAGILALAGGVVGVIIAAVGVYLFRTLLVESLGFPFLFPSSGTLAALVVGGLALALVVVGLAALFPALRICRQEPANSMRE
jgi:putative ABC transport system permease protein